MMLLFCFIISCRQVILGICLQQNYVAFEHDMCFNIHASIICHVYITFLISLITIIIIIIILVVINSCFPEALSSLGNQKSSTYVCELYLKMFVFFSPCRKISIYGICLFNVHFPSHLSFVCLYYGLQHLLECVSFHLHS